MADSAVRSGRHGLSAAPIHCGSPLTPSVNAAAAHPEMPDATSSFGCPVVQDYHFPAEEEEILKFWQVRTDWK